MRIVLLVFLAACSSSPARPNAAPAPAPCTPGMDQTCNDDPAISSLWGQCRADGTCACREGFAVNPATGRCRPAR